MTNRERIEIDKTKEMRTKDISKMISEGGLGSEKYYEIKKDIKKDKQHKDEQ